MVGETYKTESDEAWAMYQSGETVNNDSASPPANSSESGVKLFMKDFGLDKAMNPETLMKIYGTGGGPLNKKEFLYLC